MVLSQKAYILFYIKNPINGHALPAQLAQHAQQLPNDLNGLLPASVKGQRLAIGPTAPDGKHDAAAAAAAAAAVPVYGPAQHRATVLPAAKPLHDELLAPVTASEAVQPLKVYTRQKPAATPVGRDPGAIAQANGSGAQLPSPSKGKAESGPGQQQPVSQAAAAAEGPDHHQVKPSAKRKADALGSSNNKAPVILQKMSPSGINATAHATDHADSVADQASPKKKKKPSTEQAMVSADATVTAAIGQSTTLAGTSSGGLSRHQQLQTAAVRSEDCAEPAMLSSSPGGDKVGPALDATAGPSRYASCC